MILQFRKAAPYLLAIFLGSCTGNSDQIAKKFPSDILSHWDQWNILLGDGTRADSLLEFEKADYFYVQADESAEWIVFKTPNSGITSKTSSNTRSEMGQKQRWLTDQGGVLEGTLKIMHVSELGDPTVAASHSVVVGQIHSDEGHENEPLKIFYKKFPGHKKGSVFWNYEINTLGDNSERWDYSTAVWGYDMSVVAEDSITFPAEPEHGIALGESWSYKVEVAEGVMHLTFSSPGHPTREFVKDLHHSEFADSNLIPEQIRTLYSEIGRDGIERPEGYKGELQIFKQGAYNQTNGKDPGTNNVWHSGAQTFEGNIEKQYQAGGYAEVWFSKSYIHVNGE